MKKITLKDGYVIELDESKLNNMELLDALSDVEDGNELAVSRVCKLILGVDARKKLYDHLRENGIVPIEKVSNAILEVFNSIKEGKN